MELLSESRGWSTKPLLSPSHLILQNLTDLHAQDTASHGPGPLAYNHRALRAAFQYRSHFLYSAIHHGHGVVSIIQVINNGAINTGTGIFFRVFFFYIFFYF